VINKGKDKVVPGPKNARNSQSMPKPILPNEKGKRKILDIEEEDEEESHVPKQKAMPMGQNISGDFSDILNKFSSKNKQRTVEPELQSSEPTFMKPIVQKDMRSSLPRGVQHYSVGKTRPVKPAANLNNSMISGENPNLASRTSLNQGAARDKARSSLKNLLPQKRQSKTELLENPNNYSTIEPYYLTEGYASNINDRSLDQSINQTYDAQDFYFTEGNQPSREKRPSVKLPLINPNATFNHRTSDYGLAIEEAKDGKQKQGGHEKKIPILPKIESYPFSEVEGIDQLVEEKYLDVDFTNVKLRSSKMLRHYLKLGIPEARGILNITGTNTVQGLIDWFASQLEEHDVLEVVEHLQTAIGSSSRTAFLVCIIITLGEKGGISFEKFRQDPRVIME